MKINSLVVKISDACNLNCTYCGYYFTRGRTRLNMFMSIEVLEAMLQRTKEYSDLKDEKKIQLCWAGGEPLLAGLDFFFKIIELQNYFFDNSFSILNTVQTNGTLINHEWAQFFKEYEFEVGLSIDGMRDTHNKHRPFRSGGETYDRVVENIELLRDVGISPRVLCVIHPEANGRDIFNHFISLGVQYIDFLPTLANYETKNWCTSFDSNIGTFLIDAFDAWYELDNPQIRVRLFADLVAMILGAPPASCTLRDNCSGHLTIEHDGSINNCECSGICGDAVFRFNKNVKTTSFVEIEDIEIFKYLNQGTEHIGKNCLECDVYYLCRAGCPSMRFKNNSFRHKSIYCDSYRRLVTHIRDKVLSDLHFSKS